MIGLTSIHHQCTYQVLQGSHQEQERNFPSFYLYEFEEFVDDHSHQAGLSQLEPPTVLVCIIWKKKIKSCLPKSFSCVCHQQFILILHFTKIKRNNLNSAVHLPCIFCKKLWEKSGCSCMASQSIIQKVLLLNIYNICVWCVGKKKTLWDNPDTDRQ